MRRRVGALLRSDGARTFALITSKCRSLCRGRACVLPRLPRRVRHVALPVEALRRRAAEAAARFAQVGGERSRAAAAASTSHGPHGPLRSRWPATGHPLLEGPRVLALGAGRLMYRFWLRECPFSFKKFLRSNCQSPNFATARVRYVYF